VPESVRLLSDELQVKEEIGLRGCRRTVKSATSRLDWTSYQLELGDRDSSSDGRTERFSLAAAAAYWPFLFNA